MALFKKDPHYKSPYSDTIIPFNEELRKKYSNYENFFNKISGKIEETQLMKDFRRVHAETLSKAQNIKIQLLKLLSKRF